MQVALIGAELQEDLTIRHLWSALEASGHDVVQVVFDRPEDLERAARRLAASGAALAGMSMVFTSRAREFVRLAERARELGYTGHVTAGGHFAAFNAEALLRDVPAIDSVVVGEGEYPLCDLAAQLDDLSTVNGLVWRTHDGRVVRNLPSPKPGDLDALPWPVRRRPYDDYLGLPIANMLGSRGCSHGCSFCSISAWHRMCGGARLRLRAPERVAAEMADLWADGVRIFNFHDDNFVLPNRRLMLERIDRMQGTLERLGVGRIAFAMKARPDEIDRPLLERLMEMGLFRVFLGVEAGTARSLVQLGRGQKLEDNERALAITEELGLHASFNLLLWNPDSTLEDLVENVDWLRDHPKNPTNFSRTEIYAGTPFEGRLRESGRLLGDYWGFDYRITDPRAEDSFQVAYAAFAERNFGKTSLHHSAMRLDYEYHLFAHFFGEDEALRRRVKGYVETVNLDTYAHLSRILRAVGEGIDDRAGFTAGMVEEVAARDRELDALARRVLSELHRAVSPARSGRIGPYANRARAAALVAALSLGGAACSGGGGDTGEPAEVIGGPGASGPQQSAFGPQPAPVQMVPTPSEQPTPPPDDKPTPQAQPTPTPSPPPVVELGAPEAIRRQFNRRGMRHLVRGVRPPRDTTVELRLDSDGDVTGVTVHADGLDPATEARITDGLRRLVFTGPDVVGRRFVLMVTAAQIRAAATPPAQAVRPPDVDITHPREAAHRPFLVDPNE